MMYQSLSEGRGLARMLRATLLFLIACSGLAVAQPLGTYTAPTTQASISTTAGAILVNSQASSGLVAHDTLSRDATGSNTNTSLGSATQPNTTPVVIMGGETTAAMRIFIALSLIAFVPALMVCATAFLRIIVVLSMLRHALGLQETPPNTVLIGLALFLTMFTMSDVVQQVNKDALQPFLKGQIGIEAAFERGSQPMREFMIRQTREQDLALLIELSKAKVPQSIEDVSNAQLVPAFMLSELRTAFIIGFVIFLPFLLIDLIVSSVLMALGMMMMPPITVALPIKILMFVLIDGWGLVVGSLVRSFH